MATNTENDIRRIRIALERLADRFAPAPKEAKPEGERKKARVTIL